MNDLLKRSVSGFLYSAVLVLSAYFSEDFFYLLLFGLSIILLIEYNRLLKRKNFTPFIILFLLFYALKEGAITVWILYPILGFSALIDIFLLFNLFGKKNIPEGRIQNFLYCTFYISTSLIYLLFIANIHHEYKPWIVINIFLLVWINDSFAYLVGVNFGKRKLFEKVSPKKTLEGTLGGAVFCVVGGIVMGLYNGDLSLVEWVVISLMVASLGTLGDLIQSKYKRQTGVKDSGNFMPGHGGIYDRLDSIVLVSPFILIFLLISNYVS
jgi:phosphatidate cytidylyltransferase